METEQIFTESSLDRPVQKRKSGTKVRTGCLTCKTRRVKCDEELPSCRRCMQFGVACGGYKPPLKNSHSKPNRRVILPKRSKDLEPKPKVPVLNVALLHTGAGFEEELSGQCFKFYLEDTAKQFSGPFQTSLWQRLIPQISEIEPFVRHAIIAIGALSKQGKSPSQSKLPAMDWEARQYHYALTQYGKSVQGMRKAIANGHHDLRKALVACLLVFCFEGMLGNQASAALHAESGLMLLHNWSTSTSDASSNVSWLSQKTWKDQMFEGDLLTAFTALDSQVLIFMDHRSAEVHQRSKVSQNRLIQTMPPEFYNLELARQFWKLIMNRNYHFSKQSQAGSTQEAKKAILEDPWEGSAQMGKEELLLSASAKEFPSLKDELTQYEDDIKQWRQACSQLFAEIAAGTNQCEKIGAAILQVQCRMSQIMLAGTMFNTETEYDAFLPAFTEIVDLSELIVLWILSSHQGLNPCFYFDVGIVPALFLVASRCRKDVVRISAMNILFSANYREGIWDAVAVAHMAKWLRELEREDLVADETIPEEKRVVLSAVNIDLFNKRALVAASQGPQGARVQRKTLLVW